MQRTLQTEIHWAKNELYAPLYNPDELVFFQNEEIEKVHRLQQSHQSFTRTPLYQLKHLAKHLKVEDIQVKDESFRFGLNAFKVLGGIYAMAKFLADRLGEKVENLSFEILKSKKVKRQLGTFTFISATDGNHGRGVAWAARELGHRSVILLPKGSSEKRLAAIRAEGAEAEITDMNYDDTVRLCAEISVEKDWVIVQDTAWDGYDEIPLWIMQGYASMAKEIVEQLEEKGAKPPTHLFLQAGVGSFAGAITAFMAQFYREDPPIVIVVEPEKADCYYRSFSNKEGKREIVTGDMFTIMAGLACGEPNTRAFRILGQYAKAGFSCSDNVAALGMRLYGNPLKDDPRIISGESGAVTLGLVYHLYKNNAYQTIQKELNLNSQSRILLISTEGDTDPAHYQEVVWKGLYPN